MIYLKPLEISDAKDLFHLVSLNKLRLTRYFPVTIRNNETLIATTNYLKQLKLKTKRKALFTLGVYVDESLTGVFFIKNIDWHVGKCELGYFIDKNEEGKGIMTKAFDHIIEFCFGGLELEKIFVRTGIENGSSRHLVEKKGFVLEGVLRNDFRTETNELVDVAYYGLVKP